MQESTAKSDDRTQERRWPWYVAMKLEFEHPEIDRDPGVLTNEITEFLACLSSEDAELRMTNAFYCWQNYAFMKRYFVDQWTPEKALFRPMFTFWIQEAHRLATRILMQHAEAIQVDSAAIWQSANHCRHILGEANRQILPEAWPQCLGITLYDLPVDVRQSILDGNAIVMRLRVVLTVDLPGDEIMILPSVPPAPDSSALSQRAGTQNCPDDVESDPVAATSGTSMELPSNKSSQVGMPDKNGWNSAGVAPPPEFQYGPITGQARELVRWIMNNKDPRNLRNKLLRKDFWGRNDKRNQYSVWFTDQKRFAEANTRRLSEQL